VYADGLCEPRNPGGVACYGFVAWRGDERIAEGWGVACRGRAATNNVAEYAAAQAALERLLEMGLDHMPYGGNRQSGVGREGVRLAIEEMTNIQMVAIRVAGL